MPKSREVIPEGAPAQLLEFLRDHPKSTLDEATLALGLPESTMYYALTRLRDLGLIKKASRWTPPRWLLTAFPPEASRTCREVAEFNKNATTGPPLMLAGPANVVRPTGTPVARAGGIQVIGIQGPQIKSAEYSHQGTVNAVAASHPWAYANRVPLKTR